MNHDSRTALQNTVSSALNQLTDDELRWKLTASTPLGDGIGGDAAVLSVAGTNVFVKRLPLTNVEQQTHVANMTSNIFGLPVHCHYGVGAPSTTAWRELGVHKITSDWVMSGSCEAFPVLHHWRVLAKDRPASLNCAEHGDIETWIDFWHGSDAVRSRLEALNEAPADLVLILEYIPRTLQDLLEDSISSGAVAIDALLARVEAQLLDVARCMAAGGLWHFDAHLKNILADDDRLYLTDFGLAASTSFDLAEAEVLFLDQHVEHDVAYLVTQLASIFRDLDRVLFCRGVTARRDRDVCALRRSFAGCPECVGGVVLRVLVQGAESGVADQEQVEFWPAALEPEVFAAAGADQASGDGEQSMP